LEVLALLMLQAMALPLMMGNRTPLTLSISGPLLLFGALAMTFT